MFEQLFIGLLLLFVVALTGTMILHLLVLRLPYVPTPKRIAREMVTLARLKGNEIVMDLGAGDGRILVEAKRRHPGITAIGVEYVPTVWLLGKIVIFLSRTAVQFRLGDAFQTDVSGIDVLFLYVTPAFMGKLEKKFEREMRPGTVIVSLGFQFPNRQHEEMASPWGRKIYRYVWR